jgi:hypothetical protein
MSLFLAGRGEGRGVCREAMVVWVECGSVGADRVVLVRLYWCSQAQQEWLVARSHELSMRLSVRLSVRLQCKRHAAVAADMSHVHVQCAPCRSMLWSM